MAEHVEVVIKIPKYYLTHPQDYTCLAECVRRGTILPEHHGRLIDEKVIYNKIRPLVNNGQLDDIMLDMDYVLEADKEVQDEADSD